MMEVVVRRTLSLLPSRKAGKCLARLTRSVIMHRQIPEIGDA
jgi:hypothetical protein